MGDLTDTAGIAIVAVVAIIAAILCAAVMLGNAFVTICKDTAAYAIRRCTHALKGG